jgi:teichuronic acid biosynthesis glycosyltransferase TuaC
VLESAACGTPVVAFNIGGVPEILADPTIGTVVRGDHCAAPLAAAIRGLLVTPPSRGSVRAAAVRFSWDPVLEAQLALYRRVVRPSAADTSQASAEVARA